MDIDNFDSGLKIYYKCKKINKKDCSISDKYISIDSNKVIYCNKSKTRYNTINIKNILNIRYGQSTEIFKNFKDSSKYKAYLCFSIITLKRTYDFIGDNMHDTCFIIKTLNRYLDFNKMDDNILEGLFDILNKNNPDNIENGKFSETISNIIKSLNN